MFYWRKTSNSLNFTARAECNTERISNCCPMIILLLLSLTPGQWRNVVVNSVQTSKQDGESCSEIAAKPEKNVRRTSEKSQDFKTVFYVVSQSHCHMCNFLTVGVFLFVKFNEVSRCQTMSSYYCRSGRTHPYTVFETES